MILLYDKPFWDDSRDMFGLLNEAEREDSLDPEHYARRRGRFYLIWNASRISGRPTLIALMAGNAAHDAENTDTKTLLTEVNGRLGQVFTKKKIPPPLEVIVTRWKRDPFTRGTYSYVGPKTRAGDYDLMAERIGNLHFAGEATCGTHPATVHGAFLSGLRAAAEVMDAMAGPIEIPMPLVGPAPTKQEMPVQYSIPAPLPPPPPVARLENINVVSKPIATVAVTGPIIKQEPETIPLASVPAYAPAAPPLPRKLSGPPKQSVCAGDPSFWAQSSYNGGDDLNYEASVIATILTQIGDRPAKPSRPGVNPFLLFTKAKWEECKAHCAKEGNTAGRDAIRSTLGKWWKAASEQDKQPYLVQSQTAQELADAVRKEYMVKATQWDLDAKRIREEYMRDCPLPKGAEGSISGGSGMTGWGDVGVSKRKTNVSNCVVLDHA